MDKSFSPEGLLSGVLSQLLKGNESIYPITMPYLPFSHSIYYFVVISCLRGIPFVRQAGLGFLGAFNLPTTASPPYLSLGTQHHIIFIVYLLGENPGATMTQIFVLFCMTRETLGMEVST